MQAAEHENNDFVTNSLLYGQESSMASSQEENCSSIVYLSRYKAVDRCAVHESSVRYLLIWPMLRWRKKPL